jgi:mannose-6-phosphate isomerase-like protein (cupin superfamily)
VADGRFYRKVYPHERVEHWQHHSFRPGESIPEYSLAFRMDVRGAVVGGTRAATPVPAAIRTVSADRIDLDQPEFEAEGLGIGRRAVAPGEVVLRPSTGGNRWIVICVDGELAVHRADRKEPVTLKASEMTYIPAGVLFGVRNETDADATITLVYVRRPEEQEDVDHSH